MKVTNVHDYWSVWDILKDTFRKTGGTEDSLKKPSLLSSLKLLWNFDDFYSPLIPMECCQKCCYEIS